MVRSVCRQSLACLFFFFSGFSYGYDIGATSFVLAILRQPAANSNPIPKTTTKHLYQTHTDDFYYPTSDNNSNNDDNSGNNDNDDNPSFEVKHHSHHSRARETLPILAAPTVDATVSPPVVWWSHVFGPMDDDKDATTTTEQETDAAIREGIFISAISLGALLGSHLVLFHLAATIGRRMELRLAALLHIVGTLCTIASGTVFAESSVLVGWPLLLLGRLVLGVGVGFVMHGAPNYMAEMAPSSVRGAIVSAKESLIVLGIVVGYAVGDYHSSSSYGDNNNWALLYQISLLFSVPMLALTFWVPRSTRWLLLQHQQQQQQQQQQSQSYQQELEEGHPKSLETAISSCSTSTEETTISSCSTVTEEKDTEHERGEGQREDYQELSESQRPCRFLEEAMESMQFVYRDNITNEFDEMVQWTTRQAIPATRTAGQDSGCCGTLGSLLDSDPAVTWAMVVALGLLCFQEGSGQPAVLSYATVILEQAGWGGHASVWTACLMLCVSIVTVGLVDTVGRKRLLQICATIMGLAILVLCWNAPSMTDTDAPEWQRRLVLLSLCVYVAGYQLGFGPITWLLVAEVFPSHIRGPASALAVELKYLLNFVVQFGVPIVQRRFGWRFTFACFGILMAVAALFFIPHYVQETKGLSLEQIQSQTKRQHRHDHVMESRRRPCCNCWWNNNNDNNINEDEEGPCDYEDESIQASLVSQSEEAPLLLQAEMAVHPNGTQTASSTTNYIRYSSV